MEKQETKKYLINTLCFLAGFVLCLVILYRPKKTVEVTINESAVTDYVKLREDSLRKVYDLRLDSLEKTKTIYKTEIKTIYKIIDNEKSAINHSNNIDSLRSESIEYIKSIK